MPELHIEKDGKELTVKDDGTVVDEHGIIQPATNIKEATECLRNPEKPESTQEG